MSRGAANCCSLPCRRSTKALIACWESRKRGHPPTRAPSPSRNAGTLHSCSCLVDRPDSDRRGGSRRRRAHTSIFLPLGGLGVDARLRHIFAEQLRITVHLPKSQGYATRGEGARVQGFALPHAGPPYLRPEPCLHTSSGVCTVKVPRGLSDRAICGIPQRPPTVQASYSKRARDAT